MRPWFGVLAALVGVRLAIPLVALAAEGHDLPAFPPYDYEPLNGDAFGFYAEARELISAAAGPHGLVAAAVLAAGAWAAWRLRGWRAIAVGALAVSLAASALVVGTEPAGAAVVGWPLVWAIPLFPLRVAGVLDVDAAFAVGLALSLAANAVTVVATAYAGLYASGRRAVGLAAAALFAAWPFLARALAGESAWENGQWNVDVGLHLYTEPLSTALVAVAIALVLSPRASDTPLALAGAAVGFATVVKLSNVLVAAIALAVVAWRRRRGVLPFAASGLAFAPLLAVYWPKGYPKIPNGPRWDAGFFPETWTHSLVFDVRTLLVLAPLALLGAWAVRRQAAALALLAGTIAATAVLYSVYQFTAEHPRFLYAALPALFVLEAAGALAIASRAMRIAALAGVACLAALALPTPATAADALTWRATGPPFRLVISRGGTVVAEQARGLAASAGSPFTYRIADGSLHRLVAMRAQRRLASRTVYTVSTDEPGRTATVDVRRTPRGLRIAWSLEPSGGVVEVYEAFTAAPGEHFLGTGQREHYVDLHGQIVQLKTSYTCASSAIVPFYLSSRGYGVYFDTPAPGHAQFAGHHDGEQCSPGERGEVPLCRLAAAPDRVQACFRASRLAYEVYAGRPLEIVRAFSARVGRPSLPPPSQFSLIKWRDSVAGPAELLEDVDRLQRLGIPLGWILLDNPWEVGGCLGTLEFDPRFGDPKATIAAVRRRGVRFMLWISPYASREERCPFAAGYPADAVVGGPPNPAIDFTDPRALALFQSRLRALVALGVEGVKADRADELDLENDTFAGGPGAAVHNRYPVLFARAVTQVLRERGRDFATIFRAGFAGSARVHHGMWAGDQLGTFAGLRSAIRSAQTAGVSGFPIWGSDVGGYHRGFRNEAPPLSADVFVRWAQFAAVTPVFEVGGAGRNARFWELGPRAVELFRRAAILHYELFPYLYDAARRAARAGDPILRPVAFDHPADERAWKADLELLVGPDLLVAPATSAGPVRVYLPAGEWVDAFRGTRVRGPRTFLRETPLDELPLYVRAGAAIRFNARLPIWRASWGLNDLDRKGRAGWLYAPSGRSVAVRLRGAPRESQVLVLTRRRPRRVTIGGRVAPGSTLAALRRAREGWAFRDGDFGGVVLKLAPRAGRADAVVELP